MKRTLIVVVALFAGALPAAVLGATTKSQKKTTTTTTAKVTTTTSSAPIGGTVVLGATSTPLRPPVCATKLCSIVLTRATALETIRDGVTYPTTVKKAGQLVAFTVALAKIGKIVTPTGTESAHDVIAGLDARYGGTTRVALTVLKGGKGTAGNRPWTVVAESPIIHVQPYLGFVVQIPLTTPIQVTPGEVVALSVPTWATVLSYDLNAKKFAYRQSRKTNCKYAGSFEDAQLTIGQTTTYKCDYAGTRVEYNATEVLAAPYPKNYVHSTRHP